MGTLKKTPRDKRFFLGIFYHRDQRFQRLPKTLAAIQFKGGSRYVFSVFTCLCCQYDCLLQINMQSTIYIYIIRLTTSTALRTRDDAPL